MSAPLFLMTLIAMAAVTYLIVAVSAYVRARGARVILCPETQQPATVVISPAAAAFSAILERPDFDVAQCSRWPERRGCNQGCTGQIAVAPKETLALSIAKRWYAGQACALCLRPIPPPSARGAQPGLLERSPQQPGTVAWNAVAAETLPAVFETHLPVCAHCHRREQFGAGIAGKPAGVERRVI